MTDKPNSIKSLANALAPQGLFDNPCRQLFFHILQRHGPSVVQIIETLPHGHELDFSGNILQGRFDRQAFEQVLNNLFVAHGRNLAQGRSDFNE
jgi:hypothetical protein